MAAVCQYFVFRCVNFFFTFNDFSLHNVVILSIDFRNIKMVGCTGG
jgi:hypothetical protein